MKRCCAVLGLVLVGGCIRPSEPIGEWLEPEQAPEPSTQPATDPEIEAVASGNNAFALDLYSHLARQRGNRVLCPFSLRTLLVMVYGGARAETEREMARALRLRLDKGKALPVHGRFYERLHKEERRGPVELFVADSLWVDRRFRLRSDYVELLRRHYGIPLRRADFDRAHKRIRVEINQWVEKQTRGRIAELIPPGVLTPLTALTIVNAVAFHAEWAARFDVEQTKEAPFWLARGGSVKVPLMTTRGAYPYVDGGWFRMLELPYAGDALSMLVLVPREDDGLSELETTLTPVNLDAWQKGLKKTDVRVFLPRFEVHSSVRPVEALQAMGMREAFGVNADLTGLSTWEKIWISHILHGATIRVDERGTGAPAESAATMTPGAATEASPDVIFRADHPFLFLIRHRPTGAILFVGRYVDPRG